MLIKQLRTLTDDTWDKCWPVSTLRPLALLDLISYLFFVKKMGEEGLLHDLLPELPAGIDYSKDADDLSWSRFKDMDAQSMHHTFTKENGVMELMSYYAKAHLRYSDYFKAPLLITPSVILLSNAVALVKIMEVTDKDTQGQIVEHLMNKSSIVSQQGQVYLPEDVSRLMVSMLQPTQQDVVFDPALGNASLLVNSANYIRIKNSQNNQNGYGAYEGGLKGMDGDLVQLRIGAMNMMLHHIQDPELKILDKESNLHPIAPKPTIILSNLFFTGVEGNATAEKKPANTETSRKEVELLHFILKNLLPGTRVAVVVTDVILSGSAPEIVKLREEIILRSNLEAVISIGSNPLLYGAAILVFNKNKITTVQVWFAEINNENRAVSNKDFDIQNNVLNVTEPDEGNSILNLWNNKSTEHATAKGNVFYVNAGVIINNNFNLSFAANKMMQNKQYAAPKPDTAAIESQPEIKQTVEQVATPPVFKEPLPVIKKEEFIEKTEAPFDWGKDVVQPQEADIDNDQLYAENFPAPPKTSGWKKPLLYAILIISVVGNIIFFVYYNKSSNSAEKNIPLQIAEREPSDKANTNDAVTSTSSGDNPVIIKPEKNVVPTSDPVKNTITPEAKTIVPEKLPATTPVVKQSIVKDVTKTEPKQISKNTTEPASSDVPLEPNAKDAKNNRYAIISRTFFYTKPSETSHIMGSITSDDEGELISSTEKNGFVYAIFYNKHGNNMSGWLSMKDLKLVE